jgi:hypothetical protein
MLDCSVWGILCKAGCSGVGQMISWGVWGVGASFLQPQSAQLPSSIRWVHVNQGVFPTEVRRLPKYCLRRFNVCIGIRIFTDMKSTDEVQERPGGCLRRHRCVVAAVGLVSRSGGTNVDSADAFPPAAGLYGYV